MIVWLASYPRSGNSLLQDTKRFSQNRDLPAFFYCQRRAYWSHRPISGRTSLSKVAVSDHTYFIKTHDPPQDHAKAIYIIRDGGSTVISYFHFLKDFTVETKSLEDVVMGDFVDRPFRGMGAETATKYTSCAL